MRSLLRGAPWCTWDKIAWTRSCTLAMLQQRLNQTPARHSPAGGIVPAFWRTLVLLGRNDRSARHAMTCSAMAHPAELPSKEAHQ